MNRSLLGACALLVCTAASGFSQTRADFSGRWAYVPDSAAAASTAPATGGRGGPPPTIGSGWGNDITFTQDATSLKLEYQFFTRSDMQPPHRFVFALDGTETKHTLMLGRGIEELQSKTAWDGNTLVITVTQRIPDPAGSRVPLTTTVVRTLSLEAAGLLSIQTVRSGLAGALPTSTRTMYRKQ